MRTNLSTSMHLIRQLTKQLMRNCALLAKKAWAAYHMQVYPLTRHATLTIGKTTHQNRHVCRGVVGSRYPSWTRSPPAPWPPISARGAGIGVRVGFRAVVRGCLTFKKGSRSVSACSNSCFIIWRWRRAWWSESWRKWLTEWELGHKGRCHKKMICWCCFLSRCGHASCIVVSMHAGHAFLISGVTLQPLLAVLKSLIADCSGIKTGRELEQWASNRVPANARLFHAQLHGWFTEECWRSAIKRVSKQMLQRNIMGELDQKNQNQNKCIFLAHTIRSWKAHHAYIEQHLVNRRRIQPIWVMRNEKYNNVNGVNMCPCDPIISAITIVWWRTLAENIFIWKNPFHVQRQSTKPKTIRSTNFTHTAWLPIVSIASIHTHQPQPGHDHRIALRTGRGTGSARTLAAEGDPVSVLERAGGCH